ncbi:MAG: phosphohydrolase [bacterium]|nr:phosphohydrolase [bacterium]
MKNSSRWIQLHGGFAYDYDSPSLTGLGIDSVAHSLSMQCRFNGHCLRFYSVAEHSVLVHRRVAELGAPRDVRIGALLHDAAEIIICDIPAPLKRLPEFADISDEMTHAEQIVARRWPADYEDPRIKQADLEMLATEKEQIMHAAPRDWGRLPDALPWLLRCWRPSQAAARFSMLARAEGIDV